VPYGRGANVFSFSSLYCLSNKGAILGSNPREYLQKSPPSHEGST
jgi:hypothetical protein